MRIKPDDLAQGGERVVTLMPCATVTGRVVDADGKPLPGGVWIRLAQEGGDRPAQRWLVGGPFDAAGRFRVDNLPPGGTYAMQARDRMERVASVKKDAEAFKPFELARDLKPQPGQVIDLGTFNAATGKRIDGGETASGREGRSGQSSPPATSQ